MSRKECEKRLLGDITGVFLVRESKGRRVLSVKTGMDDLSHYNIHQDVERGGWSLDREKYFSLDELVHFYRENEIPNANIKLKL